MLDHTRGALELDDMREIIHILANVVNSDITLNQKRINLLRGISILTQTDAWVWGVSGKFEAGKKATFSLSHHEGFTEKQFAAYLAVLEEAKMAAMFAPVLTEFASSSSTLTRRRDQFDPDGLIYTDAYSEWREIGFAPIVVSLTSVPNGGTSCVAIYRKYDSPPTRHEKPKLCISFSPNSIGSTKKQVPNLRAKKCQLYHLASILYLTCSYRDQAGRRCPTI